MTGLLMVPSENESNRTALKNDSMRQGMGKGNNLEIGSVASKFFDNLSGKASHSGRSPSFNLPSMR